MKLTHFGRYVLMLPSLLMSACWWDYRDESTSCIHFANTEEVGIHYATLSDHADRTDHHVITPAGDFSKCGYDYYAIGGPVIVKRLYRVAPYLHWLGEDSSIIKSWDLSAEMVDAASRWLDSAAWMTDTVFQSNNPDGVAIYRYHHTFTFRSEDVR